MVQLAFIAKINQFKFSIKNLHMTDNSEAEGSRSHNLGINASWTIKFGIFGMPTMR